VYLACVVVIECETVECAGQGKRDCSISSVLSGLIELSKLEVGVKVDDNRIM